MTLEAEAYQRADRLAQTQINGLRVTLDLFGKVRTQRNRMPRFSFGASGLFGGSRRAGNWFRAAALRHSSSLCITMQHPSWLTPISAGIYTRSMSFRWAAFSASAMLAVGLLGASNKTVEPGRAENETVNIEATAHIDAAEFPQLVGAEIGAYFTVVQVTVTPRKGKIKIDRDDFLLRTYHDGERTNPLAVSEIAGKADMVVHEEHVGPSEATGRTGPVLDCRSDYGRRGAGAAHPKVLTATVAKDDGDGDSKTSKGKKTKDSPLAIALKKSMLPDGETDHPVSGVLIFNLEKQKLKDLELDYNTPEGMLRVRFK